MRECITHSYGCDCREAKFKDLQAQLALAREALEKIAQSADQISADVVDWANIGKWSKHYALKALAQLQKPQGG